MTSSFPYKRVLCTGASGFLGSYVVEKLRARGVEVIAPPNVDELNPQHNQCNLLNPRDREWLFDCPSKYDLVIHCAANCGGIGYNQTGPADLFYDNALMGIEVLEKCRRQSYLTGLKKFISIGTICSYPENTPVPFREEDLWNGYPEPTNAAYGMAKKMMIVQSQAYRQQYGFNSINLLLANLYGPRDNFDPETSHVIPAIIRKCVEAVETGADSITLWGTGAPTREFLHVEDAADAILLAAERYDSSEPVNIGTGGSRPIADIAEIIANVTEFRGSIIWDTSKPDGQMKRRLDVSKAKALFGFENKRALEDGIVQTIEWYKSTREKVVAA